MKLENCKQVVCVSTNQSPFKVKKFVENIHILENHSVVVNEHGIIEAVGPAEEINKTYENVTFDRVVDCKGRLLVM